MSNRTPDEERYLKWYLDGLHSDFRRAAQLITSYKDGDGDAVFETLADAARAGRKTELQLASLKLNQLARPYVTDRPIVDVIRDLVAKWGADEICEDVARETDTDTDR